MPAKKQQKPKSKTPVKKPVKPAEPTNESDDEDAAEGDQDDSEEEEEEFQVEKIISHAFDNDVSQPTLSTLSNLLLTSHCRALSNMRSNGLATTPRKTEPGNLSRTCTSIPPLSLPLKHHPDPEQLWCS